MIRALERENKYIVEWFNKKLDPKTSFDFNRPGLIGFLANIEGFYGFGKIFRYKSNHWVAITKIGDAFYNLDSKLSPRQYATTAELLDDLVNIIKNNGNIISVLR